MRFASFDRLERRSRQNGTYRSAAAIGLWYTRGDADIFISALREESGCHALPVFFRNRINDIKIVVDLGCAEIQSRSLFAADGFITFELRRSQFRSHGLQGLHGFCDPRVRLSVPDAWSSNGRCYEASSGKNADEQVLAIHL